jgi:anti-sigma factor RsiW
MRCSSFEPLLDDFVDGTLPQAERRRVLAHVDACESCRALLEELRVIDALLLTPRQVEPAPNFTFRTMADVRAMPQPHVHRTPALRVAVAYLIFAWAAIGAWFVLGGQASRATLAVLASAGMQYGHGISALAHVAARIFGRATPDVELAMGAILAFDAVLAGAVLLAYFVIRRLGRWSQSPEVSS